MRLVDRVILTLYTFALAFLSLSTVLLALGWNQPLDAFQTAARTVEGRWTLGILGLIFFAVSLRLLYAGFRRQRDGRPVRHEAALGEVFISLDAIENLVGRVARGQRGVRDARPAVETGPEGLCVRLRTWVSPDVNIPRLAEDLQQEIGRYVEQVVGVQVAEVRIAVENITTEARRSRVD